jgi:hypothetical protein
MRPADGWGLAATENAGPSGAFYVGSSDQNGRRARNPQGEVMGALGCDQALLLDGGISGQLLVRDADGAPLP